MIKFFEGLHLPALPWIPPSWHMLSWVVLSSFLLLFGLVGVSFVIRAARKPKLLKPFLSKDKDVKEEGTVQPISSQAVLKAGLSKTRGGFIARLGQLFSRKEVNVDLLEQLEEILFSADVGAKTAHVLFERVKQRLSKDELLQGDKVLSALKEESLQLLNVASHPINISSANPFTILVIGVNGAGKTTTIGKLSSYFIGQGKQVMLAAGDTFRAAAVEQLAIWGDRALVKVVQGKAGGDPSSVIFDAMKQAKQANVDVLIADTAGRLHVKSELMEELRKIRRVMQKSDPSAPHETWLVLDATMGQNAIAQATTFKEAMDITGIVLTKLDGTAKGGVVLGICHELQIPVRFIGVGEKAEDLLPFDAQGFIDALYETKSE